MKFTVELFELCCVSNAFLIVELISLTLYQVTAQITTPMQTTMICSICSVICVSSSVNRYAVDELQQLLPVDGVRWWRFVG